MNQNGRVGTGVADTDPFTSFGFRPALWVRR